MKMNIAKELAYMIVFNDEKKHLYDLSSNGEEMTIRSLIFSESNAIIEEFDFLVKEGVVSKEHVQKATEFFFEPKPRKIVPRDPQKDVLEWYSDIEGNFDHDFAQTGRDEAKKYALENFVSDNVDLEKNKRAIDACGNVGYMIRAIAFHRAKEETLACDEDDSCIDEEKLEEYALEEEHEIIFDIAEGSLEDLLKETYQYTYENI